MNKLTTLAAVVTLAITTPAFADSALTIKMYNTVATGSNGNSISNQLNHITSVVQNKVATSVSSNRSRRYGSIAQRNKATVIEFYQKLFGDKDVSAVDQYISKDYIQHNPSVADGREALKTAVTQWFAGAPKDTVDIQHTAAEGDLVFLHIRGKNQTGGLQTVINIFKLKDGLIVEHWDAIQDVPATSLNDHPMF